MNDLISLRFDEVLNLQPALLAGCVLMTDERRLYGLQSDPEKPFVVFGLGVEAQGFSSLIDAWCSFTDRVHVCDHCDGGWIGVDHSTTFHRPCGYCMGFGKLTDRQLEIVQAARGVAFKFLNSVRKLNKMED